MPDPTAQRPRLRPTLPSLNFLVLVLIFAGTGAAMWHGFVAGRFPVFVFVVAGWVVSLCLHEFGHAVTAYWGGDTSIAKTGYLDLDPMRFSDPVLSIVLPLVYILIGGFGLPGGAVYIRFGMLRSKAWAAFVSAAGPLMNLVFLLALAGLYALMPKVVASIDIASGLAVLALFQATAIVLNLLPFPGLDGFGILRPFLRRETAIRAEGIGALGFLILFLLIWLTPVGGALIRLGLAITSALGFHAGAVARGFAMLKLF